MLAVGPRRQLSQRLLLDVFTDADAVYPETMLLLKAPKLSAYAFGSPPMLL